MRPSCYLRAVGQGGQGHSAQKSEEPKVVPQVALRPAVHHTAQLRPREVPETFWLNPGRNRWVQNGFGFCALGRYSGGESARIAGR
jgi:hypothetical protein